MMSKKFSTSKKRESTSRYDPIRSVRIGDEVWETARRRANFEGVNMSTVLQRLTEGYARSMINLPRLELVYTKPQAEPAVAEEEVVDREDGDIEVGR